MSFENVYGAPPAELTSVYVGARQFSPLSPGAERLSAVAPGSLNGIAMLAEEGPGDRYQIGRPMKTPELMHRLMMQRPKPCLLPGWIEYMPQPSNWAQLIEEDA